MNPHVSNDRPLNAKGRFGRLSYLAWLFLSSIILIIAFGILAGVFGLTSNAHNPENISVPAIIIAIIFYIAFIYFSIVFMVRRLHDRNHSGWLILLMLVPIINLFFALYLLFAKGTLGANNFGEPRITAGWEKVLGWLYILLIPLAGIFIAISIPTYQSYFDSSQENQLIHEYNEPLTQE